RTRGGRRRLGRLRRVQPELRGELSVARLKESHERAVSERAAHGLDLGELVAAPEHVEELRALAVRLAKRPQLEEDHAPGQDRQEREGQQDAFGDVAGAGDQRENRLSRASSIPSRRNFSLCLQEQGKPRASKREQTTSGP